MPRIYLVRHAKPAAAWGDDPDPGLDALGVTQAAAVAQQLAEATTQAAIYSSPLRRCPATAAPLSERGGSDAPVLPSVAEIPSPPVDREARREWLTVAMNGTWAELQQR